VEWFCFPRTILHCTDPAFARWFPDGRINITHNLFDRFLPLHAHKQALIWVSNMLNAERIWTLR
jgi:propionyl-CoA synthetase